MENNVSARLLLNLVLEKHGVFKSYFPTMLQALSDNNQGQKLKSVQDVFDASKALASVLSNSDQPNWLNQIIKFTGNYLAQNKTPDSVVSQLKGTLPF